MAAAKIVVSDGYVRGRANAELAGKKPDQFLNPNTDWAKVARKLVDARKAELTSGKTGSRKSAGKPASKGRTVKAASQINTTPRVAVQEESDFVTVVMPRSVARKYGFVS